MYNKIRKKPHVLNMYAEKLIKEGVVTEQEYKVRHWQHDDVTCLISPLSFIATQGDI